MSYWKRIENAPPEKVWEEIERLRKRQAQISQMLNQLGALYGEKLEAIKAENQSE